MFSILSGFKHRREMRESKDEILIGEVIRAMAQLGYPAIGFQADSGEQRVRFKPKDDAILYAVTITLDRKTGGSAIQNALIGSKAVLTFQAEVKNYLADPDDLIKMYQTSFQNILKMPMLGDVKLAHQLNSVYATTQKIIDIDKYLSINDDDGVKRLAELLGDYIEKLREKLAPHKKG